MVQIQDELGMLKRKEERLLEQFSEAQELKVNVDKRFHTVSGLILDLLGDRGQAMHRLYVRTKVQLLLHQRLIADKIQTTEQQLEVLKSF